MAELANCIKCGKLFVRTSSPYCPDCRKEQEDKFDKVYAFIREQENRMATVPQVHEATGVETELIYQWVREGRLVSSMFPNLGYPCKSCGKIITEGALCPDCRQKLEEAVRRDEKEKAFREQSRVSRTYHTKRNS
ncbi:TIGR03826 family flagellar region protein [Sporolactobacillus sp. Y61]|uniref:TIGR03826 family flagellar region protein n=1 Tax=Sporolactobacillus sp. Y61 TaxID=3160863 RepID=A0AAU8ICC6_9BACL